MRRCGLRNARRCGRGLKNKRQVRRVFGKWEGRGGGGGVEVDDRTKTGWRAEPQKLDVRLCMGKNCKAVGACPLRATRHLRFALLIGLFSLPVKAKTRFASPLASAGLHCGRSGPHARPVAGECGGSGTCNTFNHTNGCAARDGRFI